MYKDYPPAYQVSKGKALQVDTAFYERIRDRADQCTLIEQFEAPISTGRAWKVPAGHVFRVTTPVGPQVGDFNVWSADDPRERLWAARTRQLQGADVSMRTGCGRTCHSCDLWCLLLMTAWLATASMSTAGACTIYSARAAILM